MTPNHERRRRPHKAVYTRNGKIRLLFPAGQCIKVDLPKGNSRNS